jgi:hypothetical protein
MTMRVQPAERGTGNSFTLDLPKNHQFLKSDYLPDLNSAINEGIQAGYDRGAFSFPATGTV